MISGPAQFSALRTLFGRAIQGMRTGAIRHGAMFETPAACLQADEIFRISDFGCLGTNDLICHLFGLERNSSSKLSDDISESPVLWDMISRVVIAGRKMKKPGLPRH